MVNFETGAPGFCGGGGRPGGAGVEGAVGGMGVGEGREAAPRRRGSSKLLR